MDHALETFADQDRLADRAAEVIAAALEGKGRRSVVVTGGGTPGPAYDRLARQRLNWAGVTVTLSDERWVDPASPLSNEKLVRDRLLVGRAAQATFLPLKGVGASPEADAAAAETGLSGLAPFAAVLLGMGEDGHIASLFPGAPGLGQALDPDGDRWCVGVDQAGLDPKVPRISLTLRALIATPLVIVLITGQAKRDLIGRVGSDAAFDPPVAALLRQACVPVRVLWAP